MGGVLETYEKLIGHMLNELPTPSPETAGSQGGPAAAIPAAPGTASDDGSQAGRTVREDLNYILKKVQELRRHHYQEQDKLLKELQTLGHIQVERRTLTLREEREKQSGCRPWALGRNDTVLG